MRLAADILIRIVLLPLQIAYGFALFAVIAVLLYVGVVIPLLLLQRLLH